MRLLEFKLLLDIALLLHHLQTCGTPYGVKGSSCDMEDIMDLSLLFALEKGNLLSQGIFLLYSQY